MSSGIPESSSRGPNSESMRYLIGGENDARPKRVGKKNKAQMMEAAAPDKNKAKTLPTKPVVGNVKAQKKKAAKSVRLGNVQTMLTVSLTKRPELILKDGEFPTIIQNGAQEIISAIHKATNEILMRKYIEQFTRSEKLLSVLNEKLIALLNQTPEKNKKQREEITKLSRVIESVLRQFHNESAFVEKVKVSLTEQQHVVKEVAVQNEAQVEPEKRPVAMPADVVGLMGAYLGEKEGNRALDELLHLFSGGTGNEVALLEMQRTKKINQKVSVAIFEAMQKEGPFIFPEHLSEAELSAVTHLSNELRPSGEPLTAEVFREIIARLPHLTGLTLDLLAVTEEAAAMFDQLKRLRSLTFTRHRRYQAPVPEEILRKIIVSLPHLSSLNLTSQYVTDNVMALVVQLKELRHLDLTNVFPKVSAETLRRIVTHLPQLTSLHLSESPITNEMMDLLSQLKELQSLSLNTAKINDELLQQLAKCSTLQALNLRDNYDITTVQPLAACLELEELDLDGCSNLISLQGLSACTKLLSLSILNSSKIQDFGPLSACTQLRKLSLLGCPQLKSLQPLATCLELEELKIYRTRDLTSLQGISACKKLLSLKLFDCENLKDLGQLAACTKLKELDLTRCRALTSLLPLLACSQLQKIVLPDTWNAPDMQAEKEALQKALPQLQFVGSL